MHTQDRRHKPLPSRSVFARRLVPKVLIAAGLVVVSLGIGMVGYRGFEGMPWLDAFLNASMILTGMGPVSELHTGGGKLFAGCYAIFSGVIFLTLAALVFGPVLHRFLHRMHLEIESTGDDNPAPPKQ